MELLARSSDRIAMIFSHDFAPRPYHMVFPFSAQESQSSRGGQRREAKKLTLESARKHLHMLLVSDGRVEPNFDVSVNERELLLRRSILPAAAVVTAS
jgi:hypothetical protein